MSPDSQVDVTIGPEATTAGDSEDQTPLGIIIKDSFKLIPKIIGPYLLALLFVSLIGSILLIIGFLPLEKQYFTLAGQLEQLRNDGFDPTSTDLTPEQQTFLNNYSMWAVTRLIYYSAFQFFPLIALILILTGKTYNILTKDSEAPNTWIKSIKAPFRTRNSAFTTIFLIIIYSLLVPLGLIALYLPGFIVIIYGFFGIQALVLDEKEGAQVFKGGKFYASGNFSRMTVLLFLFLFIPMLGIFLISPTVDKIIGYGFLDYQKWAQDPYTNIGKIFLYNWFHFFFENILYFGMVSMYTVAFHYIRKEKILLLERINNEKSRSIEGEQKNISDGSNKKGIIDFQDIQEKDIENKRKKEKHSTFSTETNKTEETNKKQEINKTETINKEYKEEATLGVKIIELHVGQRSYYCPVCGQKLIASAKKCHKCGQLYRPVIRK